MRNFILILKWFTFRRWHLKSLVWDYSKEGKLKLYQNMRSTDMGGCRIPTIGRDLKRILEIEDKI
ncbi:hypothetical protein phiA829_081 [Aeromonas phage phiA8-29]|uniref:Uncharacterized protein n=1 Tax=Aeromonas phage phiA8-29 TaxID=1978922 RepID=A0A1W6DYC3_9CAUD|nr:hypothetical protein HWB15_gp082 [Aeromonas phage phiA8-29]ARK07901.1 hypothetical protein phiA829_081 [Aeromonas phage phiA8-29]